MKYSVGDLYEQHSDDCSAMKLEKNSWLALYLIDSRKCCDTRIMHVYTKDDKWEKVSNAMD